MSKPQPRIAITDPNFRYFNAASTDVTRTFRAARKRMAEAAEAAKAAQIEAKVMPLHKAGAK